MHTILKHCGEVPTNFSEFSQASSQSGRDIIPFSGNQMSKVQNGIACLSGQDSIRSKYLTGTTPSKPSVNMTWLSET